MSNCINQEYIIKSNGEEIDLSNLVIRYYFNKSDLKNMNSWCDNAEASLNEAPWYKNITSKVKGNYKAQGKDNYIELKINDSLLLKPNNGSIKIKTRLANNDWSNISNFTEGKVVALYDGKVIA